VRRLVFGCLLRSVPRLPRPSRRPITAPLPIPIGASDARRVRRSALQQHLGSRSSAPGTNIVTDKWIFHHKFNVDGSFDRYKARWVLRGFTQRPAVDYDETFSPVVKPATIGTVLSLVLSQHWSVHQLDVKNASLHGTLTKTVYCPQPTSFVDPTQPHAICRLNKSLYGLKQVPRAWYNCFATHLLYGLSKPSQILRCLYIIMGLAWLTCCFMSDIVLTSSSQDLLRRIITALQKAFSMRDLGTLHFLGVAVQQHSEGLFLSQQQYALDILERAGMSDCKPCSTPVNTHAKVTAMTSTTVNDPTQYHSLVGALQNLTFTWPDISYVVQQVCLHMHDPWEVHLSAVKRIPCYLRGTLSHGLLLRPSTISALLVYTDADWAGCPGTCRSTTSSPSPPSGSLRCLAPVQRLNTWQLLTVSLKLPGCVSYYKSFTIP
jgi:hypothetical protein